MKKTFNPTLFKARVYQSGSSSAKPFEIGLERGEIFLTDLEGNLVDELQGDDWNLSLGGTNDEKVILKHVTLGHTIVVDLAFLNALAEGTNYPHLTDQAKKLKKGDFTRSIGRSSGMIVLGGILFLFVAWVIIGFSFQSHDRNESQTDNVTEREGHSVDAAEETDGQKYVKLIEPLVKENWSPPHSSENLSTVFKFSISRDGHISNIEVSQSSGSDEFDALGLVALKKVNKLPPLPDSLESPVTVEFTFAENVHRKIHHTKRQHNL